MVLGILAVSASFGCFVCGARLILEEGKGGEEEEELQGAPQALPRLARGQVPVPDGGVHIRAVLHLSRLLQRLLRPRPVPSLLRPHFTKTPKGLLQQRAFELEDDREHGGYAIQHLIKARFFKECPIWVSSVRL